MAKTIMNYIERLIKNKNIFVLHQYLINNYHHSIFERNLINKKLRTPIRKLISDIIKEQDIIQLYDILRLSEKYITILEIYNEESKDKICIILNTLNKESIRFSNLYFVNYVIMFYYNIDSYTWCRSELISVLLNVFETIYIKKYYDEYDIYIALEVYSGYLCDSNIILKEKNIDQYVSHIIRNNIDVIVRSNNLIEMLLFKYPNFINYMNDIDVDNIPYAISIASKNSITSLLEITIFKNYIKNNPDIIYKYLDKFYFINQIYELLNDVYINKLCKSKLFVDYTLKYPTPYTLKILNEYNTRTTKTKRYHDAVYKYLKSLLITESNQINLNIHNLYDNIDTNNLNKNFTMCLYYDIYAVSDIINEICTTFSKLDKISVYNFIKYIYIYHFKIDPEIITSKLTLIKFYDTHKECIVCFTDDVIILECMHYICFRCLKLWMIQRLECPYCRAKLDLIIL